MHLELVIVRLMRMQLESVMAPVRTTQISIVTRCVRSSNATRSPMVGGSAGFLY